MINAKIPVVVMMLFFAFSTDAEAKLYKWVDDQGVTHYGEVIPPEYAGKKKVEFDNKGRVVEPEEETKSANPAAAKESPAVIEQKRRDQALLGSFSNVNEIDLARDRNLQQVNLRSKGIQERMKTAQDDLAGYQKEQDALTKAGKPADKVLQQQIDQSTARVARLKEELDKSQAEADEIRARYDADKKRYQELTGQ
jgi:Domain of unknown function (DUF4124)